MTYGTDLNGKQTGLFFYDVWDPAVGAIDQGHLTLPNQTGTDLFCSGQILLPSGNLFLAGGDLYVSGTTTNRGNPDTNVFQAATNSLVPGAKMYRPRWYASLTTMPNNDIYIQGGDGGQDLPELRTAAGGARLLTNAPVDSYDWWYPRNFVAPDGRVFGYDVFGNAFFITTQGTGTITPAGAPAMIGGRGSSAAMMLPGKILNCGGATTACAIIDINGPRPIGATAAPLASLRQWVTLTVLPNGKVLATGGGGVEYGSLEGVNNTAAIWDPGTDTWNIGPAGVAPRLYHSTALLLPDGSVLVSGGGAPGPVANLNAEIYRPPYLFNGDASATRPTIVSAPTVVTPGDAALVTVGAGNDVAKAVLIKTGSVTHSFNVEQRRIPLPFTRGGDALTLQLPSSGADLTPGFYMLFVLDSHGTPSVAKIVRINESVAPIQAPWTVERGNASGDDYQLSCGDDQVLAGVYGAIATSFNSLGPRCVTVAGDGKWIGDPVNGPRVLASNGGTDGQLTCPRDTAVAGTQVRSGTAMLQFRLSCRALSGKLSVTSTASTSAAWGPGTGTQQAMTSCGSDRPAFGLYGRMSTTVNSHGLLCRRDLDPNP